VDLASEPEEPRYESCFCDNVVFRHPSNSSLADHMDCFNSFKRSRRAMKCLVTLRQPGSLFDRSMVLLNGLITNDKFCLSVVSPLKLGWVRGPRAGVGLRVDSANLTEDVRQPLGGEHATKMGDSTSVTTDAECGTALGSCLSTSPGVDPVGGAQRSFQTAAAHPKR
jgi:hypothetical protein